MGYSEEQKIKWLKENAYKGCLLCASLSSLNPDIGWTINVEKIDIPQELFPEEYKIIQEQYNKVIEKLKKFQYGKF